jgi:hypothetical protein
MPISTWRSSALAPARAKPTGHPVQGWSAGAGAVPRSNANGWRSTRTRPIRPGQIGGGGLTGPAVFHRGGIGHPDVIGPQAGISREAARGRPALVSRRVCPSSDIS